MPSQVNRPLKRRGVDAAVPPTPGPVTALRELARRAGRYAVELGEATVAPLSVEAVLEFRLKPGVVLDAATLARLLEARAATACYDQAIDALARRARATRDLERWLRDRDHPPAAIATALDRLTALGLLDDFAFARAFARSRSNGRGFGPRRVVAELARKGVSRATIDAVMGERAAAADEEAPGALSRTEREHAATRAVAERRVRALASLAPDVARRRLTGWLVRRGHAAPVASAVARELLPR